ncbi:MAG: hypothetical protein OEM29_05810 [Thermoplasmata archaeon]|nr:hypothetical protein [Thermoplasmata archaeon]
MTTFYVAVTDLSGNGVVTNGDCFTITGDFTSGTQYTVILIHEPSGGQMVQQSWTA